MFLGGNPSADSHGTVASFAGGSVMSTSYTDLFNLTEYGVKKLPTTASFSWAHEQVYSFNDAQETLEYKPVLTHTSLDVHWDQDGWYSDNKLLEIAQKVNGKMKTCMDHMWVENPSCSGDDENGVYGNKCVGGTYVQDCTLIACQKSYWLVNGKCEKIPAKYTPEP